MKIVFVSKEFPPSARSYGIGTYVWEISRSLRDAGHKVTVIAASDDAVSHSDTVIDKVRLIRLPDIEKKAPDPLTWNSFRSSRSFGCVYAARAYWKVRRMGFAYRAQVAERLEKLIDEDCADIVEFPGYRGESLVWAKMLRRIPMVTRVHGMTAWVHRSWKTSLAPRQHLVNSWEVKELLSADHVTVVAKHMYRKVASRLPVSRVSVIHNGIDASFWSEGKPCAEAQIGSKDILFVGSLTRGKGVFLLIRAAEMLRESVAWKGRLVLVGRGGAEFDEYVRRMWGSADKIPEWICASGHRSRESLPGLYAGAGVCCLPSLNEGFNYTGLEAMASGAVVVGSSDGMAELVSEKSGFIVPAGDLTRLCSGLRAALQLEKGPRESMQSAARRVVKTRFDSRTVIEQTIACYRDVISTFHAPEQNAHLVLKTVERENIHVHKGN